MPTFIVIPDEKNNGLDFVPQEIFGDDSLNIGRGVWLISYQGTTKQVAEKLGIIKDDNEGEHGSGVVLNFTTFHGWADLDIWEWLSNKRGAE